MKTHWWGSRRGRDKTVLYLVHQSEANAQFHRIIELGRVFLSLLYLRSEPCIAWTPRGGGLTRPGIRCPWVVFPTVSVPLHLQLFSLFFCSPVFENHCPLRRVPECHKYESRSWPSVGLFMDVRASLENDLLSFNFYFKNCCPLYWDIVCMPSNVCISWEPSKRFTDLHRLV